MGTLIIGSVAMNRVLGKTIREPHDVDVISDVSFEWPTQEAPYTLHVDTFWDDRLFGIVPWNTGARVASLNELYTIKVSHSYWELPNKSWRKHIEDAMLLKAAGAKLDQSLHDLLYSVWSDKHGAKRVNLDQDKESFFQDAVVRKYDHDSIHDSVAFGERPLYESILKDGSTVAVDMKKLKALPYEDKVNLFLEEVYATALERKVIPSNYTCSPGLAYQWALKRTITSLTKGWSAQFMVENFDQFRKPSDNYVERHLSKAHKLIPINN